MDTLRDTLRLLEPLCRTTTLDSSNASRESSENAFSKSYSSVVCSMSGRALMPMSRISVPTHLSREKVRALADAVQAALVQTCDVSPKDRFQLISRFADQDRIIDPTFPDVERTSDASIIEAAVP